MQGPQDGGRPQRVCLKDAAPISSPVRVLMAVRKGSSSLAGEGSEAGRWLWNFGNQGDAETVEVEPSHFCQIRKCIPASLRIARVSVATHHSTPYAVWPDCSSRGADAHHCIASPSVPPGDGRDAATPISKCDSSIGLSGQADQTCSRHTTRNGCLHTHSARTCLSAAAGAKGYGPTLQMSLPPVCVRYAWQGGDRFSVQGHVRRVPFGSNAEYHGCASESRSVPVSERDEKAERSQHSFRCSPWTTFRARAQPTSRPTQPSAIREVVAGVRLHVDSACAIDFSI